MRCGVGSCVCKMMWLPSWLTSTYPHWRRARPPDRGRSSRAGVSSEGEHFIAHEVQPDAGGLRAIKIERLNGLLDVGSQLVLRAALGEDALRQALRAIAAVGFLRNFEHDFVHNLESKGSHRVEQVATRGSESRLSRGSALAHEHRPGGHAEIPASSHPHGASAAAVRKRTAELARR